MKHADPRIQVLLDRLATADAEKMNVKQMAQSVQLSASRFSHLFALATGITPRQYLKRMHAGSGRDRPKS